MKPRTLQILQTLIEDFIETANPIASKKLIQSGKLEVSSATIRNEFALLEEIGLIRSPHISAGKIPTQKGYRFFVDEFCKEDATEAQLISSIFDKHLETYKLEKSKEVLFDGLRLMAQLSSNVAFCTITNDRTFYLGLSNVLRCPEYVSNPEQAAQIVEILEGRERFQQLLSSLNLPADEIKIFIGEENLLEEIASCTLILTPFTRGNIKGNIGILGPMRMRYGFNRALLKNVLRLLEVE